MYSVLNLIILEFSKCKKQESLQMVHFTHLTRFDYTVCESLICSLMKSTFFIESSNLQSRALPDYTMCVFSFIHSSCFNSSFHLLTSRWKRYRPLWKLDKTIMLEKFAAKNPTCVAFDDMLQFYSKLANEVSLNKASFFCLPSMQLLFRGKNVCFIPFLLLSGKYSHQLDANKNGTKTKRNSFRWNYSCLNSVESI